MIVGVWESRELPAKQIFKGNIAKMDQQDHPFHGGVPYKTARISCCTPHHDSEVISRLADVLKHCKREGFTTTPK